MSPFFASASLNTYFLQLAYLSLSLFSLSEADGEGELEPNKMVVEKAWVSSNPFTLHGSVVNQGATEKCIMKLVEILTLAEKSSAIFSLLFGTKQNILAVLIDALKRHEIEDVSYCLSLHMLNNLKKTIKTTISKNTFI